MKRKMYTAVEKHLFAIEAASAGVDAVAKKANRSVSTVRRWMREYPWPSLFDFSHELHDEEPRNRFYDPVDMPEHYASGEIQCIDAIRNALGQGQFVGYLRGNVFKYLWRFDKKGNAIEDLRKAEWYLHELEAFLCGIY